MDTRKKPNQVTNHADQIEITPTATARELPDHHSRRLGGWLAVSGLVLTLAAVGCQGPGQTPAFNEEDQFGRTYCIDGAGDWGYVAKIPEGLRRAGYQGRIVRFRWSPFLNPALDQTIGRPAARAKGKELAKQISDYLAAFPGNQVNIIALSAGTGVATWACENLKAPAKVSNLILLGSSLSANYDMNQALQNIAGNVWVYHSERDLVLQGPVRMLGTIDGQMGVDAAGLVGLRTAATAPQRIKNIRWSPRYESVGWSGSHTDSATQEFAYHVLATHIVPQSNVDLASTDQGEDELAAATAGHDHDNTDGNAI